MDKDMNCRNGFDREYHRQLKVISLSAIVYRLGAVHRKRCIGEHRYMCQ